MQARPADRNEEAEQIVPPAPDASLKRKAETVPETTSEKNKRKNAGKVKGEFKKRSETSRGGERDRVRWD